MQQSPLTIGGDPYAIAAGKLRDLPIWLFHGTDDPVIPVGESRRLVDELPGWLRPGGAYAQECDPSQIAKVLALLERGGMRDLRAHRDPQGIERVVSARKP